MQKMQSQGQARKYPDTLFKFNTLSRPCFDAAHIHMLCKRSPAPFETQIGWGSLNKTEFGICSFHVLLFIQVLDAQMELNFTSDRMETCSCQSKL